MIFYTNRFIPKRYDALFLCAIGLPFLWVILIRPESKGDAGLLAHELKHRDEFKKRPWSYAVKMLFSKSFRYEQELLCYKEQLKFSGELYDRHRRTFARYLANNYRLDVTEDKAYEDLGK